MSNKFYLLYGIGDRLQHTGLFIGDHSTLYTVQQESLTKGKFFNPHFINIDELNMVEKKIIDLNT